MNQERTTIDLASVRPEGWLEQVAKTSPTFKDLCEVIGERFVAFALVAGVRISAVAVDSQSRDQTRVSFSVGVEGTDESQDHEMSLADFRTCLVQALVQDDEPPLPEPDGGSSNEEVQAFIGTRHLLLAEVFAIRPLELRVAGGHPPRVVLSLGGVVEELALPDFREVIHEAVRREEQGARQPKGPFSIDLSKVPLAEAALARGDFAETVELLSPWAGPLSMLLRTPQGQKLGSDAKQTLAKALGLLGAAHIEQGSHDVAEEVLRLGIQWAQDGLASSDLFASLGRIALAREQPGQAIGLLRRALSLGGKKMAILPELARSFMERERALAALVCLDEAVVAGVSEEDLSELRAQVRARLGEGLAAFRELVPQPVPINGAD